MTDTAEQPTLDDVAHADDRVDPITGDTIDATGAVVQPAASVPAVPVEPEWKGATPEPVDAVPAKWTAAMRLAARIHDTPFVPGSMRGKPHYVLGAILFGDELGIGPMQSLAQIHVIDGRPAAAPELMRALVLRAGHTFKVVEKSADKVTVYGKRRDSDSDCTVTFTMDDAKQAGLAGRPSWKNYPRAMLMARATSELCRDIFSDVIAGLSYTPDEVSDGRTVDPDTGEITE